MPVLAARGSPVSGWEEGRYAERAQKLLYVMMRGFREQALFGGYCVSGLDVPQEAVHRSSVSENKRRVRFRAEPAGRRGSRQPHRSCKEAGGKYQATKSRENPTLAFQILSSQIVEYRPNLRARLGKVS